jgi:uncharacterized membrane protein (UPF0182 family)
MRGVSVSANHLWLVLSVVVAGLLLLGPALGFVTDAWWFASVGHDLVFRKVMLAQALLVLGGSAAAVLLIGGSARWAARGQPVAVPRAASALLRAQPVRAADAVTALVALTSGLAAARAWPQVLMFLHGGSFGWRDPVWGLDAGFYVFDLVLVEAFSHWLSLLLVVALLVSAAMYVAVGTVRVQLVQQDGQLVPAGLVVPPSARHHLAALTASLLLLLGAGSFLRRYGLMAEESGTISGPGYADLYGTMPLLSVEALATLVAAGLVLVATRRGSLYWLGGALLLVVGARGATVAVPAMMQRFLVEPNELAREAPQIESHVAATRWAWGLQAVEERALSGKATLTARDVEQNRSTVENVRLWDHHPLLEAFSQVQEIRTYYGFVSVDNDRYMIDGRLRQIMLSPRELTPQALPEQARTWVNETTVYTHGYGVALGPVNEVSSQGLPELFVQDVPPKVRHPDPLRIDRPEIYFGEATSHEVVVGAAQPEFDYPSGDDNAFTRYSGRDGVPLGSLGRLLFAARLGSTELLLSSGVSRESRVLLYRNIVERARRIAPFLLYDHDPYLVIAEGRLVWVLDAMTRSRHFPYSAHIPKLGNYARSPVKVTIDAYDGTTTFWRLDEEEPILEAWDRAFPGLLRPLQDMPPALAAHLRYPQDLFAAQARLFATYHMEDPQMFYHREDEWEVPSVGEKITAPYFTVMRLPGESQEEFVLMLPFSPKGKPNLSAWMVARSDGPSYGQLRVYKFPKDTMVYGPKMVAARVNQDDAISEKLSLWNQQGSSVELGTLLVIPIEQALIYVQPLYLRAAHGSIPELKRVIVAYEDQIAMASTLEEGLERLLGSEQPPQAPAEGEEPADGMQIPQVTSRELIRRAGAHWDAAQQAMRQGDWMQYGLHMQMLGETLGALRSGLEQP